MRAKPALALLLLAGVAHAHSGGHGAAIPGKGPAGGVMAAVIAASDVELGEKAATRAIAEWKVAKGAVEVRLWRADKKTPIALAEGAQLKWILAGGRLAKAVVVTSAAPKSAPLAHAFSEEDVSRAEVLELIFPSLGSKAEKHVTAIGLERARAQ